MRGLPQLIASLLALTPVAADANDTLVGVGVTNISWKQPAAISQTLDAIHAAGFQAVRIGWKGSLVRARIALQDASAEGLSILVVLPLTDGPVSWDGAVARPRSGDFFAVNGLSQIDPGKVREQVEELVGFVTGSGIKLAGIEVGNEMNWAAFNGDLPLATAGWVVSDLGQLDPATRDRYRAGVVAYADAIGIVRDVLAEQGLSGRIPVIAGALAEIDGRFVANSGAILVSAGLTRALLEGEGAYGHADAVGIHLYEPLQADVSAASRGTAIAARLDACDRPALDNQPCWITEYGIAAWQDRCDIADDDRRQSVGALTHYLNAPENAGRVEATFFYDWADSGTYSLMRCGHLSALASDLTEGLRR